MTDPIHGTVALQHLQATQLPAESTEVSNPSSSSGPSFQDVLQNTQNTPETQNTNPTPPVDSINASDRLESFVSDVMRDERSIQKMMQRCINGDALSQSELLQLQSVIYSYTQKVDLASKIVDKATGGIKQIMNTQV